MDETNHISPIVAWHFPIGFSGRFLQRVCTSVSACAQIWRFDEANR